MPRLLGILLSESQSSALWHRRPAAAPRASAKAAKLNPAKRLRRILPLDPGVSRRVPNDDVVAQIVEHEVALVGCDGEDRMAAVMRRIGDRKPQRRRRQPFRQKLLALGHGIVVAIAVASVGIVQ